MIRKHINNLIDTSLKNSNIPKFWIDTIKEPLSSITVKFPLQREDDSIETIIGTRVIHSNHHLPTKGGLRFCKNTNIEDLGTLSALNSFRSALFDIPFGGAKGCVFIDPANYTQDELNFITRRFTNEMWKRSMISASVDVMGPDNGTTNKTMNIIKDQYKLLLTTNSVDIDNVVVGKSPNFGGLEAYNLSQGLGIACAVNYLVQNVTESKKVHQITHLDISKHKKSIIVQGFGRAGYHSAKRLYESGFYKIIGITNGSKAIYNPIGFHPDKVNKYFTENKTIEHYPSGENLPTSEVLSRKCDIVIATIGEHSICKDVAQNLKCKFFVEGRSVPQTEEAEEILKSKDIIVIPDLLASSGTHVCGYIEWIKNLEHRNLTMLFKRHESKVRQEFINMLDSSHNYSKKGVFEGPTENDLVESSIEEMIFTGFEKIVDESLTNDIDLRAAAYKISLEKMYSFFDENRII